MRIYRYGAIVAHQQKEAALMFERGILIRES